MTEGLAIQPRFQAQGHVRKASSGCCGAKLRPGTVPQSFECRACGKPCERVLSEPEEVTLHG